MRHSLFIVSAILFACVPREKAPEIPVPDEKVIPITNHLDTLAENDGFSGVVLIARNDTVLLKKAYGYAHRGFSIPNRVNTKFNYASIGKTFTAIAIFQLVEQGKLSLTDHVGRFLTNYPNATVRDSVTIQHLLTHTSGVPNYFAAPDFLEASKDRFRGMDDLSRLYENKKMESAPGQSFAYRNTNYIILGRIIEKLTGITYDDYIGEHIFLPANMTHTGNFDLDHPIENAAEGYTLSEVYYNRYKINVHTGPVKGSAAGGGLTTVNDLFHFTMALKKRRLLNDKHTRMLTTPVNETSRYGYGMQFVTLGNAPAYGHSGGHFGVGCEWRIYEKEGYTVILLTNKDADQGFLDARFYIQQVLTGSTPTTLSYFFTKRLVNMCLAGEGENAYKLAAEQLEKVSEQDLNARGYDLLKRGQFTYAIEVFKMQVDLFPRSFNAHDSLAEAYMKHGDKELAIQHYEKSLELNPGNRNGEMNLKKLEGA